MRATTTTIPVFALAVAFGAPAGAADPDCGVNEHASGGHCCRAGEEWVPAKRMCVCLEPDVCGQAKAAPAKDKDAKAAPARKEAAKAAPAAAAPKKGEEKKDPWQEFGNALVQALEFEGMVTQMKNFTSDYPRMSYAEQLAKAGRRFSCYQISRLMLTSGIDTTGVEIAFHLYPLATDPQNFFQLYGGLKNAAFSEAYLKQRLGKE